MEKSSPGDDRWQFCEKCGSPLIQFADGRIYCPNSNLHRRTSTEISYVQTCTYCGRTNITLGAEYCSCCGKKYSDALLNPFSFFYGKAWAAKPDKANLFVNSSGSVTNLEYFVGEIHDFVDSVPEDYPPRQEVVHKVAELETALSELSALIKESASKKEVNEIRGVVEDATVVTTQLGNTSRLVIAMNQANQLFRAITNSTEAHIFRDDPILIVELMNPCRSDLEFSYKLGAFRSLLEVDLKFLKSLAGGEAGEKSVKLLRRWAASEGCTDLVFDTFQDVLDICGATSPFHPSSQKIIELCRKHDQDYPPQYGRFWASLSEKLLTEVNSLLLFLNAHIKKRT